MNSDWGSELPRNSSESIPDCFRPSTGCASSGRTAQVVGTHK